MFLESKEDDISSSTSKLSGFEVTRYQSTLSVDIWGADCKRHLANNNAPFVAYLLTVQSIAGHLSINSSTAAMRSQKA
jgi:hypothetical protein